MADYPQANTLRWRYTSDNLGATKSGWWHLETVVALHDECLHRLALPVIGILLPNNQRQHRTLPYALPCHPEWESSLLGPPISMPGVCTSVGFREGLEGVGAGS